MNGFPIWKTKQKTERGKNKNDRDFKNVLSSNKEGEKKKQNGILDNFVDGLK